MGSYIIRRLLLLVPTLFLVAILIFSVGRMIPGSVIELMVAEMAYEAGFEKELTVAYFEHELGLDVPMPVQFGRWLGVIPLPEEGFNGVLQGNLGRSLWTDRSVGEEISARSAVSLEVGLIAIVIGLLMSIPIGTYSAIRQDTLGDYAARSFAIIAISLPGFWVGTLVIVYPSIWWGWMPSVQYIPFFQNPWGNIQQFIIPGMVLSLLFLGGNMRMTRTMMLEVLRQDYIRTAWAKGLSEGTIIVRHALRNALIPVLTLIGIQIPVLISGAVVIEQIFALPGMGLLLIEALNTRDYPVISGINLIVASFVLLVNLAIDLTYAYLDPRVAY